MCRNLVDKFKIVLKLLRRAQEKITLKAGPWISVCPVGGRDSGRGSSITAVPGASTRKLNLKNCQDSAAALLWDAGFTMCADLPHMPKSITDIKQFTKN